MFQTLVFWEAKKIWRNLPQGLTLLSNVKILRKIAPIFLAFSEYINFINILIRIDLLYSIALETFFHCSAIFFFFFFLAGSSPDFISKGLYIRPFYSRHYGNAGSGVFKRGIQNQKGFWLKINCSQMKLPNFDNRSNGQLSKIGHHFRK